MTFDRLALGGGAGIVLLLGPTCTDYRPGIRVEVDILHHYGQRADEVPETNRDGTPRRFTTDLGYEVELERGYVVIAHVQLVACPAGGGERAWRALLPRGLAQAHELTGDPTLLGVPYVDSALRADFAPGEVGTMEPPPGQYCQARVAIGPADADALALPAEIDMVGRSLYLEGTYRPPDRAQAIHFVVQSSDTREVLVPLVDMDGGEPTPLVLDGDHLDVRLTLAVLTNFCFDGVDLGRSGEAEVAERTLDAIGLAIIHHPGP